MFTTQVIIAQNDGQTSTYWSGYNWTANRKAAKRFPSVADAEWEKDLLFPEVYVSYLNANAGI